MSARTEPTSDGVVRPTNASNGVDRYDLQLASVPVPLLVAAVAATATGASVATALGVGAVAAALVVGYCLFVAGPV